MPGWNNKCFKMGQGSFVEILTRWRWAARAVHICAVCRPGSNFIAVKKRLNAFSPEFQGLHSWTHESSVFVNVSENHTSRPFSLCTCTTMANLNFLQLPL